MMKEINLGHLDLNLLVTFEVLMRVGNVTRAADELETKGTLPFNQRPCPFVCRFFGSGVGVKTMPTEGTSSALRAPSPARGLEKGLGGNIKDASL